MVPQSFSQSKVLNNDWLVSWFSLIVKSFFFLYLLLHISTLCHWLWRNHCLVIVTNLCDYDLACTAGVAASDWTHSPLCVGWGFQPVMTNSTLPPGKMSPCCWGHGGLCMNPMLEGQMKPDNVLYIYLIISTPRCLLTHTTIESHHSYCFYFCNLWPEMPCSRSSREAHVKWVFSLSKQ